VPLPGGNFRYDRLDQLAAELGAAQPLLGEATAQRLARTYGTLAREIFAGNAFTPGLHFGAGLYEREVAHLVKNEWAMSSDDILWRRTKLGLHLGDAGRRQLADWLAARLPSPAPASHVGEAGAAGNDGRWRGC
jgi:glycerol-3-phosphate dehydrogenase